VAAFLPPKPPDIRNSTVLFEGLQALPARISDKNIIKLKMTLENCLKDVDSLAQQHCLKDTDNLAQ